MNVDSLRFRMTAIGVVVMCLFGALFARLWYLQVLQSNQFRVAAQQNGIRLVYSAAPRGRILDRKGRVIVDNRQVNVVTVDRLVAKKQPVLVNRVAALLGEHPEQVKLAIGDPRFSDLAPVPIAPADGDVITFVKEHAADFPGVDVEQQVVRTYPYGSLAAHLLGYVGEINDNELAVRKSEGYHLGDGIGKSGVELAYEPALRGEPGVTKLEVDSKGKVLGTLERLAPVQGHDLRLTIDLDTQILAEDSLAKGLAAARGQYDKQTGNSYSAPAGAVVIQDPRDGSVLGLASQPTYDPSQFVNGIPTDLFAQLTDPASNQPLTDRATSGLYAPGSTFKLVTATAALDRGLVTPGTPYYDKGYIQIGPQKFKNDGGNAYGTINLQRAITVSSDSYFYSLGAEFWQNGRSLAIQDTARLYGFGARTGIPIGGEQAGRVPDPTTRRKEYEQNPRAFVTNQWFTGDNVNLAIGQGDLVVTPLQLSNAYATFANGGTLYQPRVAVDTENQDGSKVADIPARAIRQVPLAPGDRAAMLAGFSGVVQDGDGTAHGAFAGFPFNQLSVAGKTGTAQVNGKEPTSVFVSWGPSNTPQYEVTVFEEQAGYGASASAPVARRILDGLTGKATPAPVYIPNAAVN
ncbi:MAG: penicillin-binding protein 2 [Acidimicrobiales bacterium]